MSTFWIVFGVVLILLGLLDLFLSALNYDESGLLSLRLQALLWLGLRALFRRLPERWRAVGRAQVVGMQILLSLIIWVGLEILGFGFVYFGLMHGQAAAFKFSGSNIGPDMDYAVYFSAAQLSTVGPSGVTPETTLLRALSIVETLLGLGLVTLAVSFVLGVFQTISSLTALSSHLYNAAQGTRDPLASLSPHFPKGQPTGLSSFLGGIYQSLGAYYSGLRLHHTAYYFGSRHTHLSLPYTFHMLGGVVAALRWGLPEECDASQEPLLTSLTTELNTVVSYLEIHLGWKMEEPPPAESYDVFARAYEGRGEARDVWVAGFLSVEHRMRQMAHLEDATRRQPDIHEAYARYTEWLPFAFRTEQAVERIARDLGYDLGSEVYGSHA